MTKARDLANLISGGFTEADIPNLSASKITSGTFADARIAASNVSQHATSFDDNKIVNDISTLGLRVHTQENLIASNSNSASFDVFQDSSGITNLTNANRNTLNEYISTTSISYGTSAYETGDRTSIYTVTNDGNYNGNATTGTIDGNQSTNNSYAWYFNDQAVSSSRFIRWDLGSGNSKIYTGIKEYSNSEYNQGYGNWEIRASNNATDWTILKSSFEWINGFGANGGTHEWTNTNPYRYIELRGVSGTDSSSRWHTDFEFKVTPFTSSFNTTGSFEGNAISVSSTNKMGAVITYQDAYGTNALNTDIILKLSADNGSNYTTATLTALPDFATGIKMAKVNDLSVTAGTSLKYKLSFANQASGSKEARIRGVSLQY